MGLFPPPSSFPLIFSRCQYPIPPTEYLVLIKPPEIFSIPLNCNWLANLPTCCSNYAAYRFRWLLDKLLQRTAKEMLHSTDSRFSAVSLQSYLEKGQDHPSPQCSYELAAITGEQCPNEKDPDQNLPSCASPKLPVFNLFGRDLCCAFFLFHFSSYIFQDGSLVLQGFLEVPEPRGKKRSLGLGPSYYAGTYYSLLLHLKG